MRGLWYHYLISVLDTTSSALKRRIHRTHNQFFRQQTEWMKTGLQSKHNNYPLFVNELVLLRIEDKSNSCAAINYSKRRQAACIQLIRRYSRGASKEVKWRILCRTAAVEHLRRTLLRIWRRLQWCIGKWSTCNRITAKLTGMHAKPIVGITTKLRYSKFFPSINPYFRLPG